MANSTPDSTSKLVTTITIEDMEPKYSRTAFIKVKLIDPEVRDVIGGSKMECEFPGEDSSIRVIIDLVSQQEMVRSTSKDFILEVKIYINRILLFSENEYDCIS